MDLYILEQRWEVLRTYFESKSYLAETVHILKRKFVCKGAPNQSTDSVFISLILKVRFSPFQNMTNFNNDVLGSPSTACKRNSNTFWLSSCTHRFKSSIVEVRQCFGKLQSMWPQGIDLPKGSTPLDPPRGSFHAKSSRNTFFYR